MTRTSLTIALLGAVAACSDPYPTVATGETHYIVHAMLGEGTTRQAVLVERSRTISEGFFLGVTPVSGATVEVTHPGGTVAFAEDAARPGEYVADLVPQAGTTYQLRVVTPGTTITGTTTVPAAPTIVRPSADTTVGRFASVFFHWTSVPAAAGYVVVVAEPGEPESLPALVYRAPLRDTTAEIGATFVGGDQVVRIGAVDSSFAAYIAPTVGDGADRRRVRTTVAGGYGVFGSYALSAPRRVSRQ